LKITFLGTGGSFPTKGRGVTSIAIQREGELLLFDCGEGTQRQMTKTAVSPMKIDSIFLTHFHGDHFLGLPGLIQTLSLMGREEELKVWGPEGAEERMNSLLEVPVYTKNFEVKVRELSPGDRVDREGYKIKTAETDHSAKGLAYGLIEDQRPGKFHPEEAKSLGLEPGPDFSRLQGGESVELQDGTVVKPEQVLGPSRPGRKIVYSGDTRPTEGIRNLAEGADVLIHEATFSSDMADEAEEASHSTTKQAAEIAKEANVEKLFLTHPSPRYSDVSVLEEEAEEVFQNTTMAEDLMEFKVKLKK